MVEQFRLLPFEEWEKVPKGDEGPLVQHLLTSTS